MKLLLFILMISLPNIFVSASEKKSGVKHPEWSYDKTIYEVNIRQFSDEGTFKAFEKRLPKLKEMGVGILWLMPIHPIGEKNRKGTLGSYYSVKDYFDVNPEFGTKEDFRDLVKKTHELGMYVIIDWVANHTAWDNKMIEEHPDWFTKDKNGNFVPPIADWHDVVDLNFENLELWDYMISALKYWVEEFDIDGYRCDVAGMVPIEFWNRARNELDEIKPVFMLAEDESPVMHEKAFDMTYAWDIHHLMNAVAAGKKNADDIREYFESEEKLYTDDSFRMRFTTNHDENSWNGTVFERLGPAAETFGAFTFVIPGMPLLYNGQEAGLDKRLDFFEKDPINWKEHKFRKVYTRLIKLKKENEALFCGSKGGEMVYINSKNDDNIFCFVREKNNDKVFAVFNFSTSPISTELNSSKMTGNYKDLFTGEKITLEAIENFTLEPWEYRIYIKD